jgi:hypothetical protein
MKIIPSLKILSSLLSRKNNHLYKKKGFMDIGSTIPDTHYRTTAKLVFNAGKKLGMVKDRAIT